MLLFATVITVAAKQNTMVTPSCSPTSIIGSSNNFNPIKTLDFGRKTAYAFDVYGGTTGPIQFDLANPAGATSITSSTTSPFAGTWIKGTWYIITYPNNQLYTVDPATGTETLIGSTGVASLTVLGMAYSDITDKTYGIFSAGATSTSFYEIDLTTGAATKVGDWSGDALIDIACDSNGLFYGPGLSTDKLYLVDPTVPSATAIGSGLGINVNYAQGAGFDKDTNILYLAAYTTTGALYTCDTGTGVATIVGAFPGGAEVDALAIPYSSNLPPETPAAPTGPDTGLKGAEYTFSAEATDPESDQVFLLFDWGDGTNSSWVGPFDSGASGTAKHTYTAVGTFSITVKAKDTNGGESGWSPAHTISITEGAAIVQIQPITGGLFKVKTSIKNIGTLAATNVNWSITLTGGAFIGKETSGIIPSIAPGASQAISSKFILGFGKTVVKVTAEIPGSSDMKEQNGTILLFFIKL